jgi:hypothetical protein
MLYKISNILHSGTMGVRGTERTDRESLARKGKIVEWMSMYTPQGMRLLLRYVIENNKDELYGKYMFSSLIENTTYKANGQVSVETENSIYILTPSKG